MSRRAILFLACAGLTGRLYAADGGARALDAAMMKAAMAGDVESILKLYGPEAVLFPPGETEARGVEAIRFKWTRFLQANTVKEGRVFDTTYRMSGSLSVGWGRFAMLLEPKKGGKPVSIEGRFTAVAEKKNGKWAYTSVLIADLKEPLTFKHYSRTPRPTRPPR